MDIHKDFIVNMMFFLYNQDVADGVKVICESYANSISQISFTVLYYIWACLQ